MPDAQQAPQNQAAPSSKARLIFSIIVLIIGLGFFGATFDAHTIVAWVVTVVGVLSIIYNVMSMRAGK